MKINSFLLIDDLLDNVDAHIADVMSNDFIDVNDGVNTFKNIQDRNTDVVSESILLLLQDFDVAYNFVRKSPEGQEEPNFIHSDEMMGDITCLLYLNDGAPSEDGTTIYNDDDSEAVVFKSKLNRLVVFDSKLKHSRNIFNNFGSEDKSRLVQVIFLNKK
jgi:hypothetical protein